MTWIPGNLSEKGSSLIIGFYEILVSVRLESVKKMGQPTRFNNVYFSFVINILQISIFICKQQPLIFLRLIQLLLFIV
jgi:hypothetical protein